MTTERSEFAEEPGRETKTASPVVFVAFVEISPRAGCRILDPNECQAALTMCFLPAATPDDALALLQERLDEELLEIVSLEYCVDAASMDELDEADTELARVAAAENRVLFGNIVA